MVLLESLIEMIPSEISFIFVSKSVSAQTSSKVQLWMLKAWAYAPGISPRSLSLKVPSSKLGTLVEGWFSLTFLVLLFNSASSSLECIEFLESFAIFNLDQVYYIKQLLHLNV